MYNKLTYTPANIIWKDGHTHTKEKNKRKKSKQATHKEHTKSNWGERI